MKERDAVNAPSLDREQGILDRLEQRALASLHAEVVLPETHTISPQPFKHSQFRRFLLAPTCNCRVLGAWSRRPPKSTSTADPSIRARGVTPVDKHNHSPTPRIHTHPPITVCADMPLPYARRVYGQGGHLHLNGGPIDSCQGRNAGGRLGSRTEGHGRPEGGIGTHEAVRDAQEGCRDRQAEERLHPLDRCKKNEILTGSNFSHQAVSDTAGELHAGTKTHVPERTGTKYTMLKVHCVLLAHCVLL